jgi:2',3'-cyclic-nucleotide 2'-phosphodiesterase (5'-nucleotidase family)
MGIGNHRVPLYELPSNISGLTFSDPLAKAQELSTALRPENDVVIALSHIGFTEDPKSVEVDANVDTNMAATVTGIDAIIGGHSHTNPASGFGDYKYLPSIVADPDNKPVIINQAYRYNNTLGEVVLGLKSKPGGGYEVVSQTGRYISVSLSDTEDAATKAIIDPYQSLLSAYNATVIGQTIVPLDALNAYTQETNGANLQADASVAKLAKEGIAVDLYLSGAVSNKKIAGTATPTTPYSLTVADLFTFIPYENSLVVLSMNGPQLKAVLERAYRNYYYYKYVPGYGGYSYYTVGMLVPDAESEIVYYDSYPDLPDGNNVSCLLIKGVPVNFNDPDTYYHVSTVNYLAAGSCNFNNSGVSLWPLNQIVADTQYYVRDAVIEYIQDSGTINPVIDGRLQFTAIPPAPPLIAVTNPLANMAVQDGVTFKASASTNCGSIEKVFFYLREPDGGDGIPIGYEDLEATYNSISGSWEYPFDTTMVQDGYYVILAKAIDSIGNESWSDVIPFSIRNWAVITLLPSTPSNKAGRTMPVKFSLRIAASVDPSMPFVYNEDLEIRIYRCLNPSCILKMLMQTSTYGTGTTSYRINGELYITNFKTARLPAQYLVEIWRPTKNFMVGSFTFKTVK